MANHHNSITYFKAFLILLFSSSAWAGILPDPKLTPGAVLKVTKEDVCVKGYAGKTRNVPESEKKEAYKRYNMQAGQKPCPCEVDHLISLQLGGSNEITNLWPEPYTGEWNAHQKDAVENHLHSEVCKGNMTLKDAQEQIRTDWITLYRKYQLKKKGNKGVITQVVR